MKNTRTTIFENLSIVYYKNMRRVLFWSPRVLAILFTVFISFFALDVFTEGYSFWETLLALSIHLIPTFILIFATVIAWKKELTGGLFFVILGFLYVLLMLRQPSTPLTIRIFMSGSLFLISGLFLLNGFLKKGGD